MLREIKLSVIILGIIIAIVNELNVVVLKVVVLGCNAKSHNS